eukprot:388085-Amphidinium_carterae.1
MSVVRKVKANGQRYKHKLTMLDGKLKASVVWRGSLGLHKGLNICPRTQTSQTMLRNKADLKLSMHLHHHLLGFSVGIPKRKDQ